MSHSSSTWEIWSCNLSCPSICLDHYFMFLQISRCVFAYSLFRSSYFMGCICISQRILLLLLFFYLRLVAMALIRKSHLIRRFFIESPSVWLWCSLLYAHILDKDLLVSSSQGLHRFLLWRPSLLIYLLNSTFINTLQPLFMNHQ